MNTRTALCAALLAVAALTTGCSSNDEPSNTDKPASTASAAATPTVDAAAAREACVDAVKAAVDADTDDTKPTECAALTDSDYAEAYMEGLEQRNQEGRDALQDLIDEASASANP